MFITSTIAFICSANVCRSLMAQAIFTAETARRGLPVGVLSAGILDMAGMSAADEARLVCERHKTPMPKLVSTHIGLVDVTGARRIFAMERRHVAALMATAGVSPDHTSLLGEFDPQQRGAEIDDPMGQDPAAFEQCYQRLRDCIVHYLDTTDDFR